MYQGYAQARTPNDPMRKLSRSPLY
jgi:hypothetical protein